MPEIVAIGLTRTPSRHARAITGSAAPAVTSRTRPTTANRAASASSAVAVVGPMPTSSTRPCFCFSSEFIDKLPFTALARPRVAEQHLADLQPARLQPHDGL